MTDVTRESRGVKTKFADGGTGILTPYGLPLAASGAAVSSVDAAAESTNLKAANAARRGLIVYNASDKDLYLKYGAEASLISYTLKINAEGGYWEMPQPIFTGVVDGIWSTDPSGSAKVTELS